MIGSVRPSESQARAAAALPDHQPIEMLNLIRCRAIAAYDETDPERGRGLSGRDAYRRYFAELAPLFRDHGALLVWAGLPEMVVIGPEDESWDIGFVIRYPSAAGFRAMVADPRYAALARHRDAAAADTRVIRFAPLNAANGFE